MRVERIIVLGKPGLTITAIPQVLFLQPILNIIITQPLYIVFYIIIKCVSSILTYLKIADFFYVQYSTGIFYVSICSDFISNAYPIN